MEGSRAAKGKVTATPLRRSRRRGTQDEEHTVEEASGGESQKVMEIEVSGGESQQIMETLVSGGETQEIMEEDKVEKVEKEHNGDQGEEKVEKIGNSDKAANGQDESSGHTDPPGGEGEEQRPLQDKEGGSLKRKRETPASVTLSVPRGKPKSGRVWKDNKKRFSDMVKDRPLRTSWDIKMKQRQEKKLVKTFAQQLKDEKRQEKEEKRKRREENLRRRLENERKAEIVQVIRNPTKLKRARKKQLRNIEKRDTLMMTQAGKKTVKKETAPAKAKNKQTTS